MLRRLFSFLKADGGHELDLEQELEILERGARALDSEQQAILLEHGGDLCARALYRDRALRYYHRALDAYLDTGRWSAAAALCRKVIDRFPDVVRARGTLGILSIIEASEKGTPPEALQQARRHLGDYARAARAAGRTKAAVRRLRSVADATENYAIRELVSEVLEGLGDRTRAEEVFLAAYEEREGIRIRRTRAGTEQRRWIAVAREPVVPAASTEGEGE